MPPVFFLEKVLKVTPLLQKYFNFLDFKLILQDSKSKSKNVFLFKLVPDNEIVVTKLENKRNFVSIFFVLMHFTGQKKKSIGVIHSVKLIITKDEL